MILVLLIVLVLKMTKKYTHNMILMSRYIKGQLQRKWFFFCKVFPYFDVFWKVKPTNTCTALFISNFFCARMRGKLRNCWCFVPFWWITPGRAILPCKIELPLICQTFNFGKPFFYWTFSQTIKDRRRYLPFPHFGDFTASINQYPIHLINFVHLCGNPLRYMFFYFN